MMLCTSHVVNSKAVITGGSVGNYIETCVTLSWLKFSTYCVSLPSHYSCRLVFFLRVWPMTDIGWCYHLLWQQILHLCT